MSKEILDLSGKTDNPDFLLTKTLEYLKSLRPESRTAVVSGIYDRDSSKLYVATSLQFRNSSGTLVWNHAEYEVLVSAVDSGVELKHSLFLSSLSACVKDSGTRNHVSCSENLINAGYVSEYVGRHDRGAATILQYKKMGLELNITSDPDLLLVCDRLYDFFNRFKKFGRNKEQIISDALLFLPKA